jgi:hypothetical protein
MCSVVDGGRVEQAGTAGTAPQSHGIKEAFHMIGRKALIAAMGATLAAGGMAIAPAAHADRLGFNLSFAGPGYGVSIGNAPVYHGRPYYRHHHRYYAPRYVPAPVYVAPPVVYRAPVVVSPPPVYYPSGRVYYRY